MMKRKIIEIDETLCTGCGDCLPNCPEGAIRIIDGKARLLSDLFCDGLGACLGHCPVGAITVTEREAEAYDEGRVMENIIKQGDAVIKAHLQHLQDHGEEQLLETARAVLAEKGIDFAPEDQAACPHTRAGCPGSQAKTLKPADNEKHDIPEDGEPNGKIISRLTQWPVQLHLISPGAAYFHKKDVLLAADCVAYTIGDFHRNFLSGKQLAIACPKLDHGLEEYTAKITALIDKARINTLTVMVMEVPCCSGLLQIAKEGVRRAVRKVPLKHLQVSLKGEILKEEWL